MLAMSLDSLPNAKHANKSGHENHARSVIPWLSKGKHAN